MSSFSYPAPFEFGGQTIKAQEPSNCESESEHKDWTGTDEPSKSHKRERERERESRKERAIKDGHAVIGTGNAPVPVPVPIPVPVPVPETHRDKRERANAGRSPPPPRTKSSDDFVLTIPDFSTSANTPARRMGMGPKTKSGRHLPKPNAQSRNLPATAPKQGRPPPKQRGVGQTQSSNLEFMRTSSMRSSSLPRTSQASAVSPEKKTPSSFKKFLLSPMSRKSPGKTQSGNLGALRRSLQMSPSAVLVAALESVHTKDGSRSPQQRKSGGLKQFLISPLRRVAPTRCNSDDLSLMAIPPLALESEEPTPTSQHARMRSRRRRSAAKEDMDSLDQDFSASKREKPKSFKQLLVNKSNAAPKRTKSGDIDSAAISIDTTFNSAKRFGSEDAPASPSRRPETPEMELSLSPEDAHREKRGSILTNFLDTLYDSYLDPHAGDMEDGETDGNLHNSVSRFDMSISNLLT